MSGDPIPIPWLAVSTRRDGAGRPAGRPYTRAVGVWPTINPLRAYVGCVGWHPESSYRESLGDFFAAVRTRSARIPRIPEPLTLEEFPRRCTFGGLAPDETPGRKAL